MLITRICDAIPMPPDETLESSSDSVQDCIHQYDPALWIAICPKFIEREENIDVEVDKWTTFYNKVPVDSRPQDVCTALASCDPNDFPAINRILVIFVQSQVVVLHVKDNFLHFVA